jgi:predicted Zn-dependent protease
LSKRLTSVAVFFSLALALLAPTTATAQQISLIRDAEIEATIRSYATPLFTAAGIEPEAVRVHIVNDDTLNAFVAGGMNLFLNTGLLMRSESANQVIGVIAHETGHIAGGHLARTQEALRAATAEAIIAYVLGIGAAIATGDGAAGAAVIGGGQSMAQRSLLKYTRTQESAADHAAVSYLDATGQSSRGMLEFFEILGTQDLLLSGNQDPYLRTHPLTSERVEFVRRHLATSQYTDVPSSPEFVQSHARMRAKLIGFLEPLGRVLQHYPKSDDSLEARYARAIAFYRDARLNEALPLIDGLIAEYPQDPYFQELKGQILYENGRTAEALPYYKAAVALQPHSPMLRLGLARVQLDLEDPAFIKSAIGNLEEVVRAEPRNPGAWRFLSVGYGRDGQLSMAALALAEAALSRGDKSEAQAQADRALRQLPEGSSAWIRAQDILDQASRPSS